MGKLQNIIITLTCLISIHSYGSTIGNEFIQLGEEINDSSDLTVDQITQLDRLLSNAKDVLMNSGSPGSGGYVCIQGTVYGPNKFEKWTGDSSACENPVKVKLRRHYACVTGSLYGPDNLDVWTGDSSACGDSTKVKIGTYYACATGTIYGPNGFKKWTGDSNYCSKAVLD